MLKRRFGARCWPGALLLLALAGPGAVRAQTGIVRVQRENFRASPEGPVLAEVQADTRLALGEERGRWREATLEGWIWAASVREERADGHDLVVATPSGENLRAGPNGRILARLRQGMRLDSGGGDGPWMRVRRSGWIWEPSLVVESVQPPAPAVAPAETPAPETPEGAIPSTRRFATTGSPLTLLVTPAGDTLARVAPGATVEVVGSEGAWSRVRIEGWARTGGMGATDSTPVLTDVSPAELQASPDRYRGRVVDWTVQFIALQEAERFRTDFVEGEPFMLTRGPGENAGFVYVAVPSDRLDAVNRLAPLQRVRIMGRIRSPASSLTGAPVLDLIELRPQGR